MSKETKKLTGKQQMFLDVLFEEAEGSLSKAKILAGYSKSTKTADVVRPIQAEIEAATRAYIANSAPQAAVSIVSVLDKPTALGNKDKLTAAKEVLDRAGFKHTEKVEVTTTSPLFILPAKSEE